MSAVPTERTVRTNGSVLESKLLSLSAGEESFLPCVNPQLRAIVCRRQSCFFCFYEGQGEACPRCSQMRPEDYEWVLPWAHNVFLEESDKGGWNTFTPSDINPVDRSATVGVEQALCHLLPSLELQTIWKTKGARLQAEDRQSAGGIWTLLVTHEIE